MCMDLKKSRDNSRKYQMLFFGSENSFVRAYKNYSKIFPIAQLTKEKALEVTVFLFPQQLDNEEYLLRGLAPRRGYS